MCLTSATWIILCCMMLNVASTVTADIDLCPAAEIIYPCACTTDGKNIRIDCIRLSSLKDLKSSLKGLVGVKSINIDVLLCNLAEVPMDLFSGLDVIKISFTNSVIHGSNQMSLAGLEKSLKELSVTFSFPEENGLSFLDTSKLHSLEHLEVEGNYISKLGNDWFENGPTNLQNVFFLTNFIEELGDKAFSNLKSIRNLWLTGNKFSVLRRSMFPQIADHLISLDLTDNKINSLPEDLFSNMPSLKEVVLAENNIKDLQENIWSFIWTQLTRVYVNDNPLICGTNLSWLWKHPRPYVLKGECTEPPEMAGKQLKSLFKQDIGESKK